MKRKCGKIILYLCFMIILMAIPACVYGAELTDEVDTAQISDEIVSFVNNGIGENEYSFRITKSDFDLSDAFTFYVDTNIFDVATNDASEIEKILMDGMYMFEVPIYLGRGTYMVDVSKGLPVSSQVKELLSEEDIIELEGNVGRWHVSGKGFYEGVHKDYVADVRAIAKDEKAEPIFVGGLPYFRYPVALLADTDGQISKLIPLYPSAVKWESLGMAPQEGDVVLDYKQIKKTISGLQTLWVPFAAIGIGAVVAACFIVVLRKRKRI